MRKEFSHDLLRKKSCFNQCTPWEIYNLRSLCSLVQKDKHPNQKISYHWQDQGTVKSRSCFIKKGRRVTRYEAILRELHHSLLLYPETFFPERAAMLRPW